MKRSEINDILRSAKDLIGAHGVALPPFARWSPGEFQERASQARHVIDTRCGWDVTDYGSGEFDRKGLFLFTLRNGRLTDLKHGRGMCYAEKLLVVGEGQMTPAHTHIVKAEDIINRGGATLVVELNGSNGDGGFAPDRGVSVMCDGIMRDFGPGERLCLSPGESVTLMPGDWHAFWGEGGDVLVGEVSTVNNDETDNIFRDPIGRFAAVEEDTAPVHLLVSDYATWLT